MNVFIISIIVHNSVFPDDSSGEQMNQKSGAASAQKRLRPATDSGAMSSSHAEAGAAASKEATSPLLLQQGSVFHLMRLCLMAVAGYTKPSTRASLPLSVNPASTSAGSLHLHPVSYSASSVPAAAFSASAKSQPRPTKAKEMQEKVTFPVPADAMGDIAAYLSAEIAQTSTGNATDKHKQPSSSSSSSGGVAPNTTSPHVRVESTGRPQQHSSTVTASSPMTVTCISFARAEEVELLWLDTCKILADLSSSTVVLTAVRAMQSLQVRSTPLN